MNNLKTFFLLTLLTLLAIGVGDYFGGQNGMILGFTIAAITNFISYFFSDKIALAMYRAQPVTREQLPRIYAVVERLTQKAALPMPKLFVIPNGLTQRLRHRTQSAPRFGCRNRRNSAAARRRGTGRRAGARTRARA